MNQYVYQLSAKSLMTWDLLDYRTPSIPLRALSCYVFPLCSYDFKSFLAGETGFEPVTAAVKALCL